MKHKDKTYKIASLFSGIGGFEVGILNSEINAEFVFASEIDKFATKSYLSNFIDANIVGDITKINEEDVPNHDILIAGFPCQSFSIAGKRQGFNTKRGTLFFEVVRIIKKKLPKVILLENVENIVSHNHGQTILSILKILNEIGYTIDFSILNSANFQVPQNRNRTYIIGILDYKSQKYINDKNKKVDFIKQELNKNNKFRSFNFFKNIKTSDKFIVLSDVLEKDVDEKYFIKSEKLDKFLNSLRIDYCDVSKEQKIIWLFQLPKDIYNDHERQRRIHHPNGISPTLLARSDTTKILIKKKNKYYIRKLTPSENFYVQGFNKPFVDNIKSINISDTQLYKQSGNAVSPPVITSIFNLIKDMIK
ncbi:DNA (cytosine-5-)-methyltransferase [Mycoplasma sp. 4423]